MTVGAWIRVAIAVLVGIAYGVAASSIPAPHDVRTFWLGNLCAPWVVIPFVMGRFQMSLRQAMLAGTTAVVSCVLAFYRGSLTVDPFVLGLARGTPTWQVAVISAARLVVFSRVWLLAGLLVGVAGGAAGWRWRESGDRRWLLLIPGVMLAEPFCWWLYEGFLPTPAVVWWVEAGAAMVLAALLLGAPRQSARPRSQAGLEAKLGSRNRSDPCE